LELRFFSISGKTVVNIAKLIGVPWGDYAQDGEEKFLHCILPLSISLKFSFRIFSLMTLKGNVLQRLGECPRHNKQLYPK
jgi:hypothetical protein